jgi:uncharacterized protein (DUF924 family)
MRAKSQNGVKGGMMTESTPEGIVDFWLLAGRDRWFSQDDGFDAEVTRLFSEAHSAAAEGRLDVWQEHPVGALALVLLLDQFPRNMFRGSPRAYATDEQARQAAKSALARGFAESVALELRPFFFLPFMHSEALADQELCIALYDKAGDQDGLKWAREHRDIVAMFGRFPHRNAALGRETTAEENRYLAKGGFKG